MGKRVTLNAQDIELIETMLLDLRQNVNALNNGKIHTATLQRINQIKIKLGLKP